MYTLKDRTYKDYPSIKELYLEMNDETEYLFAKTYFDGWTHWKKLCECSWFISHLRDWRDEAEARAKAIELKTLREASSAGNISAAKYLLEKGWDKNKNSVGRPTKAAINQKAQEMFDDRNVINLDFKRISG